MLLRDTVSRWLERSRVWAGVVYVNSIIMTVFLWHLTAFVIAIVILYPLGLGQPTEPTVRWWAERAIWITAPLLVLMVLVAIFGRFEQANAVPEGTRP